MDYNKTLPEKQGFYLARIDKDNQRNEIKIPEKQYWNAIVQVTGVAPFFNMKAWFFLEHRTDFVNHPQFYEFGPFLGNSYHMKPEHHIAKQNIERAASSSEDYNYNSDGYNHDKLLNRYE